MTILLHICCGPCAICVIERLQEQGQAVTGFFYNPNIQPLAEYMRRREGAQQVCNRLGIPCIMGDELPESMQNLSDVHAEAPPSATEEAWSTTPLPDIPLAASAHLWLQKTAPSPEHRCAFCCGSRLDKTAWLASTAGFDTFCTSLLYSRYQQHLPIKEKGEQAAAKHGVPLLYQDFRKEWQNGIARSKEWGIYRQQYCGCIYSEYERYAGELRKKLKTPVLPFHKE